MTTHLKGLPTSQNTQREREREINSGCGTTVENLPFSVDKYLDRKVLKIDARIMLNIIDEFIHSNRLNNAFMLVSFDLINMFPCIHISAGKR